MNKLKLEDLEQHVMAMDQQSRTPSFIRPSSILTILAATAMLGGGLPSLSGKRRGECRKPKNLDNSPDRAKGMKPFPIRDGVWIRESEQDAGPYTVVWAGTLKAALKKWKLMQHNQKTP